MSLPAHWFVALVLTLVLPAGAGASPDKARASGTAEPALLAPRSPYGNYIVPGVRGDIAYRQIGGSELSMDAYLQKEGTSRPAVIVVHGGGWTSGSRVARVGQLLEMLTTAGFSWFSIDYRLAPEHPFPAALDDLRAALELVRSRAVELRVDPDRLAILGEDAGAHLALLLAAERPAGLKAVVSLGGIYDLASLDPGKKPGSRLGAFLGVDPASTAGEGALAAVSPLARVAAGMAPIMIVHGGNDSQVPPAGAREYRDALVRAGVETRFLEVPEAFHDVEDWWPRQWFYKDRVVDWLSERLELHEPGHTPYRDERLTKNIVYGAYEAADGGVEELLLDAWIPPGEGPFPAVVLAHGGGWEAGDKVTYLPPILEPLARAGFAWFSIDYRLTPGHRHPDQLDDLRRAIRYVRHHAADYGVDSGRLAVLGESASGQMVAHLTGEACPGLVDASDPVDRESCEVAAAVSFYGVYDFLLMVKDASPRSLLVRLFDHRAFDDEGRRLLRRYSPLYHARGDGPPLLMLNGTDEYLWEQGVAYAQALRDVGADVELYRLDGAGHGMESWEGRPEWQGYKTKLVSWLEQKLSPATTLTEPGATP